MEGTAVDSIAALAKQPFAITVNGRDVLVSPPGWHTGVDTRGTVARLRVSTLSGLKDYVAKNVDQLDMNDMLLLADHCSVFLFGKLRADDEHGRYSRECYVNAEAPRSLFKFGEFYDLETFIIALQTQFASDANRQSLIALLNSVSDGAVRTNADDGIAQEVTTRRGVTLVGRTSLPNPVLLTPHRTFREVTQPTSPFLLRARPRDGGAPTFALFEADGGEWMREATDAVAKWLEDELTAPAPAIIR
jgi:hypothetical protein